MPWWTRWSRSSMRGSPSTAKPRPDCRRRRSIGWPRAAGDQAALEIRISTRQPSPSAIRTSRSSVNRSRSALRMRERSAAVALISLAAARVERPPRSSVRAISLATRDFNRTRGASASGRGVGAAVPIVGMFVPAYVRHQNKRGSVDGPVHLIQIRPASQAEWKKHIGIGVLGQLRHREFPEVYARL